MAKRKKTSRDSTSRATGARKSSARKSRRQGASARGRTRVEPAPESRSYNHPTADLATRPEIGTQAQFRKKKPPKTYRYDSSLDPVLSWDGQNPAREQGEALIKRILNSKDLEEAKGAAGDLAKLSQPFLNWAGKAERLSFDVPTLPLFVHERLSTKAILETLKRHRRDQQEVLDLFGDPQHSITDQVLRAYEHRDKWVNRLILGDSLVVMNSLLEYEGLGGQVQMIYVDPPYGVKFGSNFQPFVRKRDVKHNDDNDMTREPEMVQAYRDAWELGLHSYLTYLRDRLLLARDLLAPSGSIFVQISDENVHHVRHLLSEIFGEANALPTIVFRKTTGAGSPSGYVEAVPQTFDYLLWYARDKSAVKLRRLFIPRQIEEDENYRWIETPDGKRRALRSDERIQDLAKDVRVLRPNPLTSQTGGPTTRFPVRFGDREFHPKVGGWKTNLSGMERLRAADRLMAVGNTLCFVRYADDFPYAPVIDIWDDTRQSGFGEQKLYVVQTAPKVIQRCMLMSTDPGDLVFDPTCGSGTTAFVAEQWGRRWISVDTSRVPLALTRQRLLTATFRWFQLQDESRGPSAGLVYKRRRNADGEEVGGVIPHITLKSIATGEAPTEEVLVDRPEINNSVTRVTGAFVVEATIPAPVDIDGDGKEDSGGPAPAEHGAFIERMLEVLRRSPVLQLGGSRTATLRSVRPPAKALSISAEAVVDASALPGVSLSDVIDVAEEQRGDRLPLSGKPVAIVFGPENGAVSEKLVYNAAREANAKHFAHLFVIGFAIEPRARELVDNAEAAIGITATYVQATPDLMMGDLLKSMRSSQIFSVCGLPEIEIVRAKRKDKQDPERYQVRLLGVDTFDPVTMDVLSLEPNDVPAWFLDTDYNELCFHVTQAFFPKTGAWESLRKALRADYEDSVWEHLNGTESADFEASPDTKIAVKVIDTRGNELMVVKTIREALRS